MKRVIALLVSFTVLVCSANTGFAATGNVKSKSDLDATIRSGKTTTVTVTQTPRIPEIPYRIIPEGVTDMTPPVTLDYVYPEGYDDVDSIANPRFIVPNYVISRIRTWMASSNGFYRQGYKAGTLSSIGGIVLPFVANNPAGVAVGTILSLVGLGAGSNDFVSGETLISYRYLYRDGEACWDNQPNAWYLAYRTGLRETYRHCYGGVQKADMTMLLQAYNYPGVYRSEASNNYYSPDTWLLQTAGQYYLAGMMHNETFW